MGMFKPLVAGTGAALLADDSEAGVITKNGKKYIEAYQGGPKGIDRVRDEYLGSGEGNHLYTYGHYLGDEIDTAFKYKNDRQRDYDRGVNTESFNSPLVKEMESNPDQFITLKYGNAAPLVVKFGVYQDVVDTGVEMFGKATNSAQDYVVKQLKNYSLQHVNYLRLMGQGMSPEDEEHGIGNWIHYATKALARANGQQDYDMDRSIEYDIEAALPAGIQRDDLSETAYLAMKEDALLQRLELTADRLSNEYKQRENVRYTGDANDFTGPDISKIADGTEPVTFYEAVVPDDLAKKYGTTQLYDYDSLKNAKPREAGWYRNHLDMQLENMIDWQSSMIDQPEAVKEALISAAKDIQEMAAKGGISESRLYARSRIKDPNGSRYEKGEILNSIADGIFPEDMTGGDFADVFSRSVNKEALVDGKQLTELLNSKGIRGLRYHDGWSRNKKGDKEKTYNYVAYSDEYIDIQERGMATVPAQLLLAAGVTAGLTAPKILDKDIADKAPMPEEQDTRSGLDKVLGHKGFLTPYVADALQSDTAQQIYNHPVTQHVAGNLSDVMTSMEIPARLLASAVEGIYNSTEGMPVSDTLSGMWSRLQTPVADTAEEAGQATLKATGSPALATGANMGTLLADPAFFLTP